MHKKRKGNEFKKLLTSNRRGYNSPWNNSPSLIAKVCLECRETTVDS